MIITIISWLLTAISIAGTLRNAQAKIDGFYIWIVSNIGWVIYDIYTHQPAQIALFSMYTIITIYGIIQWRRKRISK